MSTVEPPAVSCLPMDWRVAEIRDFARVVRGSSPRPAGDPKFFNGSFIPWLTVAAITNAHESEMRIGETETSLTEEGAKRSRELAPETIIIANSGATLGVAKVLGIRSCANDGVAALLDVRGADKEFVCHFINTRTAYLRDVVAPGNGQPNLNTALIGNIQVPLPPVSEQREIARCLSDIDALILALERCLLKKRDLKQAAMQQLLTAETRLPGFDGPWQAAGLGTLFAFSGGFSASREQLSSSGHCYLHYGDIHLSTKPYVDVWAEGDQIPKLDVDLREVGQASLLKDGDVVFVDASEDDEGASKHIVVENAKNLPYISGLHTIVAKSRGDHLDKLFKRFCFQSRRVKEQFKFYAVGTKVSGISKSNIAKIELTFPTSSEEQRAIATVLSAMDMERALVTEQRDKLLALKQGMVQQLLTGRIRLT